MFLKKIGIGLKQAAQNSRFFMKQAAQNSRFFCCTPWFDWTTMWKTTKMCIFDQSLNLKKNWCILIKNEKMGQKIYKKCENGSKNKNKNAKMGQKINYKKCENG